VPKLTRLKQETSFSNSPLRLQSKVRQGYGHVLQQLFYNAFQWHGMTDLSTDTWSPDHASHHALSKTLAAEMASHRHW